VSERKPDVLKYGMTSYRYQEERLRPGRPGQTGHDGRGSRRVGPSRGRGAGAVVTTTNFVSAVNDAFSSRAAQLIGKS
jgi:hypothetical protein